MADFAYGLLLPSQRISDDAPDDGLVTVDELKLHLRVDHDDDDTLIEAYRDAALAYIGRRTNRSIEVQTHTLRRDCFWSSPLWLPYGPVRSITSIGYLDSSGGSQIVDDDDYELLDGNIYSTFGTSWPSAAYREGGIAVTYSAGYTTLPKELKQAAYLLVGHWYANRESVSENNLTSVPLAAEALMGLYWIPSV